MINDTRRLPDATKILQRICTVLLESHGGDIDLAATEFMEMSTYGLSFATRIVGLYGNNKLEIEDVNEGSV